MIAKTAFGNNLYIDNITVGPPPTCADPSALGTFNITTSSADAFWTSGGASHHQIQYGTAGFTPGSGMLMNVMNDTATISGFLST